MKSMTLMDAIAVLDGAVTDPTQGLPDEIFYYISRTTPLINVDLLIKDESGRTLLAWRNDQYAGSGWHIPGGIIRFKETVETRIRKVAEKEIGQPADHDPTPIRISEMIHPQHKDRGHFISLLYACRLPAGFEPENKGLTPADAGFLKWHDGCPDDLIKFHRRYYRDLI